MGIIENLNFKKDNTPPPSTKKSVSEDKHIPTYSKITKDHVSLRPQIGKNVSD